MTSYRFCRPDDMHLLVSAINSCVPPYSTGEAPPFTAEDYKRYAQEHDLWSSSCMIASEKDDFDVVAAIIGCKREKQTLLMGLGVRKDQPAGGHLPEMLESLKRKLSILGPPEIVLEVNVNNRELQSLLTDAGYIASQQFTDWYYKKQSSNISPNKQLPIEEITVDDVLSLSLFNTEPTRAWTRQLKTVQNCKAQLTGLGIVSTENLESYLFYRKDHEKREVLALGFRKDPDYLKALIQAFISLEEGDVFIPRVSTDEGIAEILTKLGFKEASSFVIHSTIAEADQAVTQFSPVRSRAS